MTIQARGPARPTHAGGYRMAARDDEADMYIYGLIGKSYWDDSTVDPNMVRRDLAALSPKVKRLHVRINSEGGDAFDGRAIYTLLSQHDARVIVHVDSLAASAASLIAMAGDEIRMADGSFLMIHEAWGFVMGGAADMRRQADLIEVLNGTMAATYAKRSDNTAAKVLDWMAEETWMTAEEAKKRGFADVIDDTLAVEASIREPGRFKRLPTALVPKPNLTRARARLKEARALLDTISG